MQQQLQAELATPFDDGEAYDIFFDNFDYGLDYYMGHARQSGGPVLDICCGTGRILLPCLKAGIDVEGLDLYDGMLDRLRFKAAGMGLNPRLHRADMSDFKIDRQFAFIMIPFNAFVHNLTTDAQIRCLQLCREHLLPGGSLAFDTFVPSAEFLNTPDGTRVMEMEIPHPKSGLPVRMYDTRSMDRLNQLQRSFVELVCLDHSGEILSTQPSHTVLRWIFKNEMELLLRLAGYSRWQFLGDFAGRLLEKETDLLIVQAWK